MMTKAAVLARAKRKSIIKLITIRGLALHDTTKDNKLNGQNC